MRKKLDLEALRKLYQNDSIIRTDRGFEMPDERSKLTMVLSDRVYVAADGSLMSQTSMLTVPRNILLGALLGFEFSVTPLELHYLCGKAEVYDEDWYFWPADLKSVSTSPDMQAVLLKAHWDRNQNVDGRGWNEEMHKKFRGCISYAHCDCDEYQEVGNWYWLISMGSWMSASAAPLSPTGLFGALFSRTMRPVLQRAGKAMSGFRRHRREYGEKIKEILNLVHEDGHDWVKIFNEDESIAMDYGAGPRDAVEPIRHVYRHDSKGLKKCQKDFKWFIARNES